MCANEQSETTFGAQLGLKIGIRGVTVIPISWGLSTEYWRREGLKTNFYKGCNLWHIWRNKEKENPVSGYLGTDCGIESKLSIQIKNILNFCYSEVKPLKCNSVLSLFYRRGLMRIVITHEYSFMIMKRSTCCTMVVILDTRQKINYHWANLWTFKVLSLG